MGFKFRLLIVFSAVLLASCVMTRYSDVPEIRLKEGEFGMYINHSATTIGSIAYSSNGRYVAIGSDDGTLHIWDIAEGRKLWSVKADQKSGWDLLYMWGVAFTPDGKYIVSGGSDKIVKLWDVETGILVRSFSGFKSLVHSVAVSPDGRQILAGGHESGGGILRLWDLESGELLREFRGHESGFNCSGEVTWVDISPDGKSVISGDWCGKIKIWEMETGREIRTVSPKQNFMVVKLIFSLGFLPDGKRFTSGSNLGAASAGVTLFDAETGDTIRTINFGMKYQEGINSPDGRHMLATGGSGSTALFDLETGQIVKTFEGFNMYTLTDVFTKSLLQADVAAFSPDGKRFVLGGGDASMRVFDIDSGQEIVMMVAFEDGEWIVITTEGYYNASPNGHKYLNVALGRNIYTADQFYDIFYRPDIVKATLRGEDTSGLVTLTMKDAIKSPPPIVEFKPVPATTSEPMIKLGYTVQDAGGGIGEVRVFHNGKLIYSDGFYREAARSATQLSSLFSLDSGKIYEEMRGLKVTSQGQGDVALGISKSTAKEGPFEEYKEIETIPGENEITVVAFNADNTVQGLPQSVRFISTGPSSEAHLYVLVIGIDEYREAGVNLKYAAKDARDMKERLYEQAATIYGRGNIHTTMLINSEATVANITSVIDDLAKKIRPSDSFALFVAGHGMLFGNQYYMLTHDYAGVLKKEVMLSSNEIVEMSKRIRALSQLFIFDTCHAGGVDHIVSGLYDARMSVLAKKMGLHMYASANSFDQALDGYNGNGLFTHALLDGLDNRPEADTNGDHNVSIVELGDYSKNMTLNLAKGIGHSQEPVIINFGQDSALYRLLR